MFVQDLSPETLEELDALKAIFDDDLVIRTGPGHSVILELRIHLDIPKPLHVREDHREALLHHLPPAKLVIALPQGYPEQTPVVKVESICIPLNPSIAVANSSKSLFVPSEARLFEMVTFVQNNTWEFVCTDESCWSTENPNESRVLQLNSVTATGNRKLARGYIGQIVDILLRYSESEDRRILSDGWYRCCVCLEEKKGDCFYMMRTCRHVETCSLCLKQYWENQIKDGAVSESGICCPFPSCKVSAGPSEIREIVSLTSYEKYERFQLHQAISCLDGFVPCRRPGCNMPASKDCDNSLLVRCAYCGFTFCCDCGLSWHGSTQCNDTLTRYLNADDAHEKGELQEKLRRLDPKRLEDAMLIESTRELAEIMGCQKCPSCNEMIEKNEGCAHMTCRCGSEFCWTCGKILDSNFLEHYFQGGSSCLLFLDDPMAQELAAVAFVDGM